MDRHARIGSYLQDEQDDGAKGAGQEQAAGQCIACRLVFASAQALRHHAACMRNPSDPVFPYSQNH